jgi:hypothetical protein
MPSAARAQLVWAGTASASSTPSTRPAASAIAAVQPTAARRSGQPRGQADQPFSSRPQPAPSSRQASTSMENPGTMAAAPRASADSSAPAQAARRAPARRVQPRVASTVSVPQARPALAGM